MIASVICRYFVAKEAARRRRARDSHAGGASCSSGCAGAQAWEPRLAGRPPPCGCPGVGHFAVIVKSQRRVRRRLRAAAVVMTCTVRLHAALHRVCDASEGCCPTRRWCATGGGKTGQLSSGSTIRGNSTKTTPCEQGSCHGTGRAAVIKGETGLRDGRAAAGGRAHGVRRPACLPAPGSCRAVRPAQASVPGLPTEPAASPDKRGAAVASDSVQRTAAREDRSLAGSCSRRAREYRRVRRQDATPGIACNTIACLIRREKQHGAPCYCAGHAIEGATIMAGGGP